MFKGTMNRVQLLGYVGNEPETRTVGDTAVTSFTIATKRPGQGGTEQTEWTTVEAWDKLGEIVAQYVTTGSRLLVEGSLVTKSWDDRETGQRRFKTLVRAEQVLLLDSKPRLEDATAAPDEHVADAADTATTEEVATKKPRRRAKQAA